MLVRGAVLFAATVIARPVAAGELVVDATVPVEVSIDGVKAAIALTPAYLRFDLAPGTHTVLLWINGQPHEHELELAADDSVVMVAGKTGFTSSAGPPGAEVGSPATIEIRSTGTEPLRVDIAGDRHLVDSGAVVQIAAKVGSHPFALRNGSGTIIWAQGTLVVGSDTVVQVSGGSMPEVLGQGSAFRPGT